MRCGILGGVQWVLSGFIGCLRFWDHYANLKGISTIALKFNKEYKPLTVAVFLVVGGLLLGSFFVSGKTAGIQEKRVSEGSSLIPQAEGAEVDSAALAVQSAPFLASINNGTTGLNPVEDTNVLYAEGALKDPGGFVKFKTSPPSANNGQKVLMSGIIYQVSTGDTLQSISSAFGVPMSKIVQFNPSVNFSSLVPGISIVIPGEDDINVFAG